MPARIIDLREFGGNRRPERISEREPPERPDAVRGERPAGEAVLLAWEAPEFDYHPANGRLLTIIGALLAAGGIAAAFFGNFLFAALLVISGGLIFSHAARRPRTLSLRVTSRGIWADDRRYEFGQLKSFWIFYDPPLTKDLSMISHKTLLPAVRVPLGDLDPVRLREILLPFLREEKQDESLIDVVAKRLGF